MHTYNKQFNTIGGPETPVSQIYRGSLLPLTLDRPRSPFFGQGQ
jgi:hypothetical protein